MTFLPMLAKNANPKQAEQYLTDDNWWAQQKLDGIRILITVEDGKATGCGRSGRAVEFDPEDLKPFEILEGRWLFDGEFVNDALYLFDMPQAQDIVVPTSPYIDRYNGLCSVYENLFGDDNTDFRLVEVARTTEEKRALLTWCQENDSEGIMLKKTSAPYLAGARSYDNLKLKFVETADVIILEVGREGKESCSVGAYHNGTLTDIGSVKLTASQGLGDAHPGDVIEVRYLNCGAGDIPRLYQPVFLKFRPDRTPESCDTSQLKFINKTIKGKV